MNRTDGIKKLMGYVEEMQKEGINICWPQFQQYDLLEMCLVSKHYGFIKWLVDNDKIDKEKVWKNESPDIFDYSFYEVVLMLLSISDTPIEDLISYLH